MKLFFGVRLKKENKKDLYEKTIKFDSRNKNIYKREQKSNIYNKYDRIEDVMFGDRETKNRSYYDSLY